MNVKRWLLVSVISALPVSACDCGAGGELTNVAPHLVFEPQSLEFGEVPLARDRTVIVRLTNEGESALSLRGASISADTDSFVLPEQLRSGLAPKQSIEFPVRFTAL